MRGTTLATVSKVSSPREATIYLSEAKRAEDLLRQFGELDDRLRELITYELSVYRAIADAVRDRTKDRLLSMGAVGIGDGVYVDPDKYPNDVWKALVIRLKSIGDDVKAALSIASKLPSAPDEDQLAYMDELSFRGFSRLLLIERGVV